MELKICFVCRNHNPSGFFTRVARHVSLLNQELITLLGTHEFTPGSFSFILCFVCNILLIFVCCFFLFFSFWPLLNLSCLSLFDFSNLGGRGRGRMVVGFTATYAISAYHHWCCEFPISIRGRCTTLCDKVCQWLATGWWFSPDPSVSSTNKTDHHDMTDTTAQNHIRN